MKLKVLPPITPTIRHTVSLVNNDLSKDGPCKSLTAPLPKSGGRNNHGHISCRHHGGGHKRLYRIINFKKVKIDLEAVVKTLEYDPNRTANIALIEYKDGTKEYMIAPDGLKAGDKVMTGREAEIKTGNTLPLSAIPVGMSVHNIEIKPGKGAQIARSAGTYAVLAGREGDYAIIKLRSGETRMVHAECYATIGIVSNPLLQNVKIGKAGRARWKGRRPTVRGVAMNPVDHPHGGGEGKTSGGRHPVTPWGKKTKGKKTRSNKRTDRFIVSGRRKNKK